MKVEGGANRFTSFCNLPEITQDALAAEIHRAGIHTDEESFWKQYKCIFGFVAQMSYTYVVFSSSYSRNERSDGATPVEGLKLGSHRLLSTFYPSRELVSINRRRVSCSLSVS